MILLFYSSVVALFSFTVFSNFVQRSLTFIILVFTFSMSVFKAANSFSDCSSISVNFFDSVEIPFLFCFFKSLDCSSILQLISFSI